MAATILNWVLGVLTLIFGGTTLVTLVQLKSLRKKGSYEAESVGIQNLQNVIHLQGEEIARLSDRLQAQEHKTAECGQRCEERITRLQEQYDALIGALKGANIRSLNL